MKNLIFVLVLLFVGTGHQVFAQVKVSDSSQKEKEPTQLINLGDSISYSMGMSMVKDIDKYFEGLEGASFSELAFKAGVMEGLAKKGRLDDAQNEMMMKAFQKLAQEAQLKKQELEGEQGRIEGEKFLAENAKKEGVKTTASGLQYVVRAAGSGESPVATDEVKVHYEGKLLNGEIFDSSIARGEPISFPLDRVIPGWTEGLQLMKPGAKFTFFIPSHLAYGLQGAPPDIAPNSTLIFEVELIEVVK